MWPISSIVIGLFGRKFKLSCQINKHFFAWIAFIGRMKINLNHEEPLSMCLYGVRGRIFEIMLYTPPDRAQTAFIWLYGFWFWVFVCLFGWLGVFVCFMFLFFADKHLMDVRSKKQSSKYYKNVSTDFAKITPSGRSLEQICTKGRSNPLAPFSSVLNSCILCRHMPTSFPRRLPAHSHPRTHRQQE